ncbi:DUF3299 domain-containing protein [Rhodovulum sp. DZ06]|uniref:DUF3299 domain-containing protein n=1 Tax=Rhodovulum sp. DZ06 TaxID=3425126 RepID=UPI003D34AB8A
MRRAARARPRARAAPAALCAALLCAAAPAAPAAAKEVVALEWSDLLPAGGVAATGAVSHDAAAAVPGAEEAPLRRDWDGRTVSLPGYVVPLDYDGTGTTAFILAPFVGACVHVPPPPASQLVLVTTAEPYEVQGQFDPVIVTGMFGAAAQSTALAEIGYALSADRIVPYGR